MTEITDITEITEEDDKFPPITENNRDTWNDIVYCWLLYAMLGDKERFKDLQYGRAMTLAENLTNLLFDALKVNQNRKKRIEELIWTSDKNEAEQRVLQELEDLEK